MKIPVILYGEDHILLPHYKTVNGTSIYFYTPQDVDITVLNGDCILYGVRKNIDNPEVLDISKSSVTLSAANSVTVFLRTDTPVTLEISTAADSKQYTFARLDGNATTEANEHYNDLLANYGLPNFEQIKDALIEGEPDHELIKRLLLDFRHILSHKGTKEGIVRFFQFLGYGRGGISVTEEYYSPKFNSYTVKPDKTVDTKTGDYYVFFDNYEDQGLNGYNLPQRETIIYDLSEFEEKLQHVVALANTYFTLKEQYIKFFGLNYSVNCPIFPSITSKGQYIFRNSPYAFCADVDIDLWMHDGNEESRYDCVVNTVQKRDKLIRTENKCIMSVLPSLNERMFFAEGEVFDDTDYSGDLTKLYSSFGTLLHLNIKAPQLYVTFTFVDVNNPFQKLTYERTYTETETKFYINTLNLSDYILTVDICDGYGNTARYTYNFSVAIDLTIVDFQLFNSAAFAGKYDNGINIEADSTMQTENVTENYVLPLSEIPADLSEYFNSGEQSSMRFLTSERPDVLPDINENCALGDVTDTLPISLQDCYFHYLTMPYNPETELKIRVYDGYNSEYLLLPLQEAFAYDPHFDALYVTVSDILVDEQNEIYEPYLIIAATDTGVIIAQETYDLVFTDSEGNETSLYAIAELATNKLPLNYDFPYFPLDTIHPFETYISGYETEIFNTEDGSSNELTIIRALWPRLQENDKATTDTYAAKIGDTVLCRLDTDTIVGGKDITWQVVDAFTNAVLHVSKTYALQYRINTKTIFTIRCSFTIGTERHTITKQSLFSSFEFESSALYKSTFVYGN